MHWRDRAGFGERSTALSTEAIAFAVAIPASTAEGETCIERETRRDILRGILGIEFGRRSLRRFHRRGNNWFRTCFGTTTRRLKPAIEFVHVSAANRCVHRRSEGPRSFFVFVHESITHY